jgi:hypothetical protein
MVRTGRQAPGSRKPKLEGPLRRANELCSAYYEQHIRNGYVGAAREKRRAIRFIQRAAARDRRAEYYCLLSDLRCHRKLRIAAAAEALRIDPRCAEAHSQLAEEYAEIGDKPRCERHCLNTLRYCAGDVNDDVFLLTVMRAARQVGLQGLAERARRLGHKRYPKDSWFTPAAAPATTPRTSRRAARPRN